MQIVIEIDEEEYRAISINKGVPYHLSHSIGNAILNGTVLPEHHGRLIEADDVDNHIVGHVDLRTCPTIIPATETPTERG